MSTTYEPALREVLRLLDALGCTGRGYTYQEKKPERHLPSWVLRVSRLSEARTLATAMAPVSIIKVTQWTLLLEFCELRLEGVTLKDGKATGGRGRPYGERELTIADELAALNRRGPR